MNKHLSAFFDQQYSLVKEANREAGFTDEETHLYIDEVSGYVFDTLKKVHSEEFILTQKGQEVMALMTCLFVQSPEVYEYFSGNTEQQDEEFYKETHWPLLDLITQAQAAQLVGVTGTTLHNWTVRKNNGFPKAKLRTPKLVVYSRKEVEQWKIKREALGSM